MQRRYISIWFHQLLADWQLIRKPELADVPFVFAAADHGRLIISAVSALASRFGIEAGMRAADAKAICPGLEVLDDKPSRPRNLLRGLGEWCVRFSPIVAIDEFGMDGLLLDVSGCAHLWGSERDYLKEIVSRFKSKGYTVRVAIADTPGSAWAISRFGKLTPLIPTGGHTEALLSLAPEALRLEQAILIKLRKLGFYQIKSFIGMPRSVLRRRFGEDFLLRLAQALGTEDEVLVPLLVPVPFQERLPCLEPIKTRTGIEIAITKMLESLCKRMQSEGKKYTLANIPQDDSAVYDMICVADTLGVFQIESRAQMSMLPRLKPREFYDLVIEVAIVRPGPILGDMVHPYLRRRSGEEEVIYPSKELEEILGRTLGVPLFQEQAMKIAIVAAGFSPADADGLRRSMATFKFNGMVNHYEKKLIDGMLAKGYDLDFAKRIFRQLEGFGSYGFPESHAASFALLVYVSCWLKHYYPDVFAAALLNSMPMGFYQPAQIVIDAQKHTVEVREVDVNHSFWDNKLEEKFGKYFALRLGLREIKGIREEEIEILVSARGSGFKSITALRDAGVSLASLERLADADAFRSIGMDRRKALWEVAALQDMPEQLFKGQASESVLETQVALPLMSEGEHVVQDYNTIGLSLKAHPVSFVRAQLDLLNVKSCSVINNEATNGQLVKVAGLILVRQRPGTAGGVCFITIEDESGFSNLVVFEKLFVTYRKEILHSKLLMVEGRLQREGQVVHVIVSKCFDYTKLLGKLVQREMDDLPVLDSGKKQENLTPTEVFHGGRNFR
jgi:hypothetical protein